MMSYETYVNLIRQLDELVAVFEAHPDPATRAQAVALLSGLDALHREGLGRLVSALREAGAQELLSRAVADPVVKVLLGLYDLVDLGLPEAPQPGMTPQTVFFPLERLMVSRSPRADWIEVARLEDLPPGAMCGVRVHDLRVLLVNAGGEVFGYHNACPGTDLPLDLGRLQGHELVCPWHGCRFDARTGRRRGDGGGQLAVYPIAVRGSSIQLARQHPPAGHTEGAA